MDSSPGFAPGSTCAANGKNTQTRPEALFAPGLFFCYNISMRDFVESNDNYATKGGPDYPIYCLKDIDDKGDYKIYAKTTEDCEAAKTKYTELKEDKGTVFEETSNPELLYASVSIACIAVVLIIVGVIVNILNKKKNKEEE